MDISLISKSWDSLAGRHDEFVQTFYDNFFAKYPDFRNKFPDSLDHQMEKMVETLGIVARVSEETEVMHPHMMRMGKKHANYGLQEDDMHKFKDVFISVLQEYCNEHWSEDCRNAWTEVFDKHIIPYMIQGMGKTIH